MSTFLVLGATGKTGRHLTAQLAAAGHTVRAAARTPGDPAPGVEPLRFDWDDTASHDAALAGADGVYVVPAALRVEAPELLPAFFARAEAAGVGRVVLLSARGVDADPSIPMRRAELALAETGLTWTVLRPTWFTQNFTEGAFVPDADGQIVAPAGDGRAAFIDTADIAAVAVAALTRDDLAGRAIDLSGPEALTFGEAAARLGAASGRTITHVDLPVADWIAGATAAGLDPAYAGMLGGILGYVRDGLEATVNPGVEEVLGRRATSVAEVAQREAVAV